MKRVQPAQARAKVEADVRRYLERVHQIASAPATNIGAGIAVLTELRKEVYEDLNQIQHEYAALVAIEWLQSNLDVEVSFFWNPRQTGSADEPDVRAKRGAKTIASAEVTTSPEPKGLIDERMRKTLQKLSNMAGKKYYFVVSAKMETRARTKIRKARWDIEVVNLRLPFLAIAKEEGLDGD